MGVITAVLCSALNTAHWGAHQLQPVQIQDEPFVFKALALLTKRLFVLDSPACVVYCVTRCEHMQSRQPRVVEENKFEIINNNLPLPRITELK